MSGDNRDHGGTCAFCGETVRPGFNTCASCGAEYRLVMSTAEAMVRIGLVMFFGLLLAAAIAVPVTGVLGVGLSLLAQWSGANENAMHGAGGVLYNASYLVIYGAMCIFAARRYWRARKTFMWFR